MNRWLAAIALTVTCAVRLGADVTITTTTSIEGGMAAAAGATAPTIVTRIKGNRSRTDVDMGANSVSTLVDLTARRAIILRPGEKTARIIEAGAAARSPGTPAVQTTVKPTGRTRDIDGVTCAEYAVVMRMEVAGMVGGPGDMPPEAAAAMKDARMIMTGSIWVAKDAPGSAEYQAFQNSAATLMAGALASGRASGMPPGMEQLVSGFADAPGIPYLAELLMGIEGTGPLVEMLKNMGQMKLVTRVKTVSLDPIAEAVLSVPEDYKVLKP